MLIEVLAGWSPRLGEVSAFELAPQAEEPFSFNHTVMMANMEEVFHVKTDFISYDFDSDRSMDYNHIPHELPCISFL